MQRACSVSPAAATIRRWLATLLLAGGAVTCFSTAAEERGRTPAASAERSPLQWIEAIQRAAVRANYSGTIVYQAGGEMRTSRITHMFDGAHSHERVQTLDGKPREYIRLRTESNDEVGA
jgi:sigma-E factor negative regulatory protein RseB